MNEPRKRTYKRILGGVAVLAAASLLVACTSGTPSNGDGPAAEDPNGSLTFGYFEPTTSMDPHIGTSSQDIPWLLPVYASLLSYAADGSVEEGLAESFQISAESMTLHLRDGLTFHDGETLDAAAVVANLERALTHESSAVASELSAIESVDATDPLTVVLTLSEPDAALPAKLADRSGMMISPAAFDDGTNLAIDAVGAGPWQLVEYSPGNRLVAERFDGYWNPDAVKLAQIEIRLIDDDDSRLNALRAGEVDIAQIRESQVALAESVANLTVRTDPALAIDHIGLNIAHEPFDDPRVREAISLAIDREALIEGLYRGVGTPASQPFPPGYWANEPSLEGALEYDPERARQLLADAGYPDGFSFEFKSNNQPFRVQATEAIAGMLAEVGIQTTIIPLEGPTILDEFYYQKTVSAYFTPWGGRADPSQTLDNLFGPEGLNNPAKITSPELTALLDRAREATEVEERGELLRQASAQIMAEFRMIPLMFPGVTMAHSDKVIGYATGLTGKANFLNVAVTE